MRPWEVSTGDSETIRDKETCQCGGSFCQAPGFSPGARGHLSFTPMKHHKSQPKDKTQKNITEGLASKLCPRALYFLGWVTPEMTTHFKKDCAFIPQRCCFMASTRYTWIGIDLIIFAEMTEKPGMEGWSRKLDLRERPWSTNLRLLRVWLCREDTTGVFKQEWNSFP